MTPSPFLPSSLSPLANLRDLGGFQAATGVTRFGAAWRADDLTLIDSQSARSLIDDGLTTIIDLRSQREVDFTGRGVLEKYDVSYHHLPLLSALDSDEQDLDQSRFKQMYINIFELSAPQIVAAFSVFSSAPGAVVFHCAAGQDRTGVLAASLFLTVGVGNSDIIADYKRTGENTAAIRERLLPVWSTLLAGRGVDIEAAARAALRSDFSSAPMTGLLDYLGSAYSDPLVPLKRAGLSAQLIDHVKDKLVDQ
ncbi:tyrosine-protein phosphatase [Corynebacterium sp. S7]